jgi:hypothetical protein
MHSPPSVWVQPVSQTVSEARTVKFDVFASGTPPLAYQWQKGTNVLAGETNEVLTLKAVSGENEGSYWVLITNPFGSTISSNASLSVMQSREVPIAEINFQDKQPSAGYSAYTYCQDPVPLGVSIAEIAGAGLRGATGLVAIADRSGLTNNPAQAWAGFAGYVSALANRTSGLDTTNLAAYKLYATVKARGLIGAQSHGRVQWGFQAGTNTLLAVSLVADFTTNYQEFSFVLADGSLDPNSGGSWSQFTAHFDQIDRVQCTVIADDWLTAYRPDAENALCIANVKFVRLQTVAVTPPDSTANRGIPMKAEGRAR